MLDEVNQRNSALDRTVACFSSCARNQFFFDGNKRTNQLLMNGILLSAGQHIITIPAKDLSEYHNIMSDFYESNDTYKLHRFLKSKQLDKIMQVRARLQRERGGLAR